MEDSGAVTGEIQITWKMPLPLHILVMAQFKVLKEPDEHKNNSPSSLGDVKGRFGMLVMIHGAKM